ncbi:MAG: outer membrane protein assembly factor BamD [Deferrisomatales bacterium]|nr:outer membrane protein assembly factor BamD [Deferrisomatales bacterium]
MHVLRFAALLAALLAIACAGKHKRAELPPEELYRQAQEAVERKRYDRAQELLDQLRDEYPFSRLAPEAELLSADMAYQQKNYEEAAAAYRSFEELHPTNPRASYALYRRGLAYAALSLPEDRDQSGTRSAVAALERLLYAHPGSEYAEDAQRRLIELRGRLAGHELYVARYYLRRKNYGAALQRLETLVQEYPDAPQRDEALRLALELQARTGTDSR